MSEHGRTEPVRPFNNGLSREGSGGGPGGDCEGVAWPSSSFGILGGAVRVMGEVGADLTGFRHLALLPPRGEAARRPAVADRLTVLRWPGELTRFRDLARPAGRWWWVVVKADAFTYSSRSAAGGSPLS